MGDKSSMEVMSRLAGIPLEVREIVESWLLITYDIPKSEEGDRA